VNGCLDWLLTGFTATLAGGGGRLGPLTVSAGVLPVLCLGRQRATWLAS